MAKILIIDDDPDIVESMKVVLESKGHAVVSASSGKDGIRTAKEDKPELIILDVMMETGDSGFEAARNLKKDKRFTNVPILMLTAIKEKTGFAFNKEAGDPDWLPVDDYVDKPLNPARLVKKVEALLAGK